MENNEVKAADVPFVVHEAALARMEKNNERMENSNRRLLIALVVVVIAMVVNNAIWIGYENHRQDLAIEAANEK